MGRASYALRLSGAALIGATLRLVGYAAQGVAARSPALCALLYLLPLAGIGIAGATFADVPLVPEKVRNYFHRPAGAEAV